MKSRSVELDKPPTFAPMRWSLVLLCIPLLLGLSGVECARSKPIDYEALEKAWEAGDEAQELRTEGDEHYRQLAYKCVLRSSTRGLPRHSSTYFVPGAKTRRRHLDPR